MQGMDKLRPCRYLEKIKGCKSPSNLLFFDTETVGYDIGVHRKKEIHRLRCWSACHIVLDGERIKTEVWRFGNMTEDFFTFLESCHVRRKRLYCFAHNVGFDLSALCFWQQLESGRYQLCGSKTIRHNGDAIKNSITCLDDPPSIVDTISSKGRQRTTYIDTLNYWRQSLAKIGESINLPKMPLPDDDADWETWYCYCRRDVRILVEAMLGLLRMWKRERLGNWKPTASGLAYQAFKARFIHHKILVHGHDLILKLERESYYGGYNVCEYIGQVGNFVWSKDWKIRSLITGNCAVTYGNAYHLDITSMYPFVMQGEEYPIRPQRIATDQKSLGRFRDIDLRRCVAWVRIISNKRRYPKRFRGRTIFVCGKFSTYLCGRELYDAFIAGDVADIYSLVSYEMAPIFKKYVEYFWPMKRDGKARGDEVASGFAKLILNSLSGKFAQREGRWQYDSETIAPQEWGHFYLWDEQRKCPVACRSVGGNVFRQTNRGEAYESVPVVSSFITSYARAYLRRLASVAGYRQVYYMDTDSLFVSQSGYDNLLAAGYVHDTEIGKLKVVGVHDYCEFRGLKNYTTDSEHTVAGIKSGAQWLPDGRVTQLEFQRLKSLLQSKPDGSIIIKEVEKKIGPTPVLGHVAPDGWVEPLYWED